MVAIKSHLRYWGHAVASLPIFALFAMGAHSASAAVKARIPELESDSTYMALLGRESELINREDSLTSVLAAYRDDFAAGGAQASHARSSIMVVELELFDIRSERSGVSGSIGDIEQQWTLDNASTASEEGWVPTSDEQSAAVSDDGAASIAMSKLSREKLAEEDYNNLKRAESSEAKCAEAFAEYVESYDRMCELLQLYNQTDSEEEALQYSADFFKLQQDAERSERVLRESWIESYDNKDFAYSILMEMMGYEELLTRSANMAMECEAEIAAVESGAESDVVVRYNFQKRSMLERERMMAERLSLQNCLDSLARAEANMKKVAFFEELPELTFVKRNFMLFEPVMFSSDAVYDAKNPIPETVIYEKGTIYRIHYGAFNSKQSPTIFHGAYPLSCDRAGGLWTYYGGGYQTYAEAEEAAALCKRKGFRRPEVVIWRNGESRNLARDPFPTDQKYRVQIVGLEELTDELRGVITAHCPDAELSKVGADRFIISPVVGQLIADEFAVALEGVNGAIEVEVIEIVDETE